MAMTKCKECGAEISTTADACPKCGAKQVRTSGCAKVVLGFLGLIVFLAIVGQCSRNDSSSTSSPASETSPPVAQVGSDVVLSVSSGDVVVCSTEEAYDEFLKLSVAQDYLGMGQMEGAGRLFRVPSGTKAKVIDTGFEKREVRIMEGAAFGRSGWVTESITR